MSLPTYYANPTTTEHTTFRAVKVTGGRKYRGTGFIVAVKTSSGCAGWRHTGYGWERNWYESNTAKIWVPSLKKFQYANVNFVEDDPSVSEEDCEREFKAYQELTIEDTIAWCRKTKPEATAAEIDAFARNVLRKHHPEMMSRIDELLPDQRQLDTEVSKTIAWAITLRTRPCFMYGRHCEGGKQYSNERYIEIARKALTKRGWTDKPEFEAVFHAECQKAGLL